MSEAFLSEFGRAAGDRLYQQAIAGLSDAAVFVSCGQDSPEKEAAKEALLEARARLAALQAAAAPKPRLEWV